MPVVSQGKLTPAYFAALKKILDPDMKENLGWANLSRPDIGAELGISYKNPDLNLILIEISSQLAKTEQAWVFVEPGEYEKRGCPDIELLTSMLNGKRPRITDFTNPKEFNIEVLIGEYGRDNLAEKVAVVNWCRSFIANKGAYIALEAEVTIGGEYANQDLHTTNTSAKKSDPAVQKAMEDLRRTLANMPKPTPPERPTPQSSTSSTSGDWVGRIHAEDGVIITIGGKPYDSKNSAHRKLAEQNGYNPNTGVEN